MTRISRFAEPFVRSGGPLFVLLAALALSGDATRTPAGSEIAVVGTGAQATDPLCLRVRHSFSARQHRAPGSLRVRCLPADAANPEALSEVIQFDSAVPARVYVAPTGGAARAVLQNLPKGSALVFASRAEPEAAGLVSSSLRRPEPVAGIWISDHVHAKRLELLRDAFPQVRRVAVLVDRWWPKEDDLEALLVRPAERIGLQTVFHQANDRTELDHLMQSRAAREVDAWYLPSSYIAYLEEDALIAHMRRLRLPAMHSTRREVERGALLAYWQDTDFAYDAMAELTLRILAGEPAGEIPVERPRLFALAARVADDPRLAIAPSVLRRAEILR